jgi:hypothetical protein
MMTAIAGGSVLFLLPSYYFIHQNYEYFKRLAFDTHPGLVQHLEMEITWITTFLFASFLFVAGVTFFLSMRVTKSLLAPLLKMEQHMNHLVEGKLFIPDYQAPAEDDFRELSLTYEYFHKSLKRDTVSDIKLLEKIIIDPENREAQAAWNQLMSEKKARLGTADNFISSENVLSLTEFAQKRRAS